MEKAGRNDPCPCGSGKKYKRCCLAEDRASQSRRASKNRGVATALGWLAHHHGEAIDLAIDADFFGGLDDEAWGRLRELPEGLRQMVTINAQEWLLAQGEIEVDDAGGERAVGTVPALELVLSAGGPLLEAEQRRWLEVQAGEPLRLWEVLETRPGEGLWLRDALAPEAPRVWVVERTASQTLARWDLLGARVVPWDGHHELSGAVYPFERNHLDALRDEIDEEIGGTKAARDSEATLVDRAIAAVLVRFWIQLLVTPRELPTLVDQGTGDPLLLVTDHYDVRDWRRLAAALAAEADVDGDREHGWNRFQPIEVDVWRSLLALNPQAGDRLEAFASTRRLADGGRDWLARVAGDAVAFRTRELTDPVGAFSSSRGRPQPRSREPEIPKTSELAQQLLEHVYRDWADQPIPLLGDKTPRQAVRSPAGRERVIELLKTYENGEARQAREERRDPASLAFLWQAVGLDREGNLG